MSGLFKAIGKAFKKVVKVIKKIALPALAIGAVVLTGGAALGVLPGLTTTLGSLGLSPALTGVLTTAAKSATFGFVGSALTGGNPIKGAVTGLVTGGLLGGASAALKPATGGLLSGASSAGTSAGAASGAAETAAVLPGTGQTISLPGIGGAADAAASSIAPAASTAATAGGGGLLSFLNQNPILAGQVLSGVGGGLMAKAQAGEDRKTLRAIGRNYDGFAGIDSGASSEGTDATATSDANAPYTIGKVKFDPQTGRIVRAG